MEPKEKTAEGNYPSTPLEIHAVNYVANDDLAMFVDDDTKMIYEHYYIQGAEYAAQETAQLREALKRITDCKGIQPGSQFYQVPFEIMEAAKAVLLKEAFQPPQQESKP